MSATRLVTEVLQMANLLFVFSAYQTLVRAYTGTTSTDSTLHDRFGGVSWTAQKEMRFQTLFHVRVCLSVERTLLGLV